MEFERVLKFLEGKSILVTGATGFLGKAFVEKVLRIQPNVKKLYLLIRASDHDSAFKRMHNEVIGKELFGVLKRKLGKNFDSFISEKIVTICGGIALEELGVKDVKLREQMWNELDLIINSAACTRFDERYDVVLDINTFGIIHVLSFAKKCLKLKMLLHVSTAYVCGERGGLIKEDVVFPMGKISNTQNQLDFEFEKNLAVEKLKELQVLNTSEQEITTTMRDFGIKRAKLYGWPNSYVFTKAMGEMCVLNSEDVFPKIIIRPAMVTSTYKEPFQGWIEGLRTIDSIIAGYGLGKVRSFLRNPKTILDLIPADMVINIMIVAMEANENSTSTKIYHVATSLRNPITVSNALDIMFQYFNKNPLTDKNGKLIKVCRWTLLSTMSTFKMYMAIRFKLPLKMLQLRNIVFCNYFPDMYTNNNRKLKLVTRLVNFYKSYALFKGIFDDTNSERLRLKIREDHEAMDVFNFDPKSIDWEDYLMNIHIPGRIKYAIKQ